MGAVEGTEKGEPGLREGRYCYWVNGERVTSNGVGFSSVARVQSVSSRTGSQVLDLDVKRCVKDLKELWHPECLKADIWSLSVTCVTSPQQAPLDLLKRGGVRILGRIWILPLDLLTDVQGTVNFLDTPPWSNVQSSWSVCLNGTEHLLEAPQGQKPDLCFYSRMYIFNWCALVWLYWLLRDQNAFEPAVNGNCHKYPQPHRPILLRPIPNTPTFAAALASSSLSINQMPGPEGNLQDAETALPPVPILRGQCCRVRILLWLRLCCALSSYQCLLCVSPLLFHLERSPHWHLTDTPLFTGKHIRKVPEARGEAVG